METQVKEVIDFLNDENYEGCIVEAFSLYRAVERAFEAIKNVPVNYDNFEEAVDLSIAKGNMVTTMGLLESVIQDCKIKLLFL